MLIAAIDIETIPNQSLPEQCRPIFDESEVKLGNLKDPAKIEAKLAEEKIKFEEGLCKKMSVTPSLAQLCTFAGIKYNTKSGKEIEKVSIQVTKAYDADDLGAVIGGWNFIRRMYAERTPLVSFNGIGFDLPVMWFRAIAQDVPIDYVMYDRLTPRYGGPFHYDLLGCLAGWTLDKMRGHTLNFFLSLYGIGSKGDMDGSRVWEAWQAGEYDKIQAYCESDVIQTCKLFQRVEPWIKIEREDPYAKQS